MAHPTSKKFFVVIFEVAKNRIRNAFRTPWQPLHRNRASLLSKKGFNSGMTSLSRGGLVYAIHCTAKLYVLNVTHQNQAHMQQILLPN